MQDPHPLKPFTRPASALVGVPGSKSITNRALALAALCRNDVTIANALESRDTKIMQKGLAALGRPVEFSGGRFTVRAPASRLFPNLKASIDVGNAGTSARFLTALVCLQEGGEYRFDGDEAMQRRPMKGLVDALASLGAIFTFHGAEGCIPFTVKTSGIKGDGVVVDASESSQILSAILIMAAGLERPFSVTLAGRTVSEPFVAMTLEMLRQFGASVRSEREGRHIIRGPANYPANWQYDVEPDATAASYFLALPAAVGGSAVVEGLGRCRLQGDIRFANVLRSGGLAIETSLDLPGHPGVVRSSRTEAAPRGVKADFEAFSDTFLTLAAISPLLAGPTRIEGIAHTRVQETDRVRAMRTELEKLGQKVVEEEGALEISPDLDALRRLADAARQEGRCLEVDTYHDHRFAMSFAILGCHDLVGDGRPWLAIRDPLCCTKTFPGFFHTLEEAWAQSHPFVTVAIDGGAASGKSSTARKLAERMGWMHVDTGTHYRAITLLCVSHGLAPENEAAIGELLAKNPLGTEVDRSRPNAKILVDGRAPADAVLRSPIVNSKVSAFAALPVVRDALRQYQRGQREVALQAGFGGLVMEGRDIGSVIFPDADVKIFLEADEATRAERRRKDGQKDDVAGRDLIDSTRKTAPLACAEGAVRIDNSHMTLEQVVDRIVALANRDARPRQS